MCNYAIKSPRTLEKTSHFLKSKMASCMTSYIMHAGAYITWLLAITSFFSSKFVYIASYKFTCSAVT